VYVLGSYEQKFGGPWDNFVLTVQLYGFGLGGVTAPIFAVVTWVAVRMHEELIERLWHWALLAAILVSSYLLLTLVLGFAT
jgi:hypothetical protein